ncbi:MAG TPA: CHASE sensor domain-containing protein [Thermoanaerobaculia bacterium]|nr:CHASE sensor domain-containing protein [Thermoanaerobaculia bacterium]
MATTCLALSLACLALLAYERLVFRTALAEQLESVAALVADSTSTALAFNDPRTAEETLKALAAQQHVVGAAVYERGGGLFAVYRRAGQEGSFRPPAIGPEGHQFASDHLGLFHHITFDGVRLGTVYIESDLNEMRARLWRYGSIAALVMVVASFLAYLLSTWLRGVIAGPISSLAAVVRVVTSEKSYAVRARKQGEDEMGQLIDGFNEMLDQIQARDQALHEARENLERRVDERTAELQKEIGERTQAEARLAETHQQLVDASRRGGMAEIATNVLHNVGNVLNSVNVSASLVAEGVKQSQVSSLQRVVELLREHQHDLADFVASDNRGKHLPAYLARLSEHLVADQRAALSELDSLRANIEHIKEIVAMQQSYAKVSGVKETVNVVELVEDSLRMNVGALSRHGVEVVREFGDVPPITVEKHKVLQILVNLVRNAKYACDESARADKRVTLRVANGGGSVRISVIDNGVGIPAENMTRIFNHGFTTRELGHGFGLHSGALAANEIGGSLHAFSGGAGTGATFTLELPLQTVGANP